MGNDRQKRLSQDCCAYLDILRQPFSGLGKPEPLRHELQGYWSRRIDSEHRLVYKVDQDVVTIIGCKYHYL